MAKANSFKAEPWTALEKGQWSIFEDDFVNSKLFTLKATRKTATSTISLKETLSQRDSKINSADELKFWFPFRGGRTIYGRLKNDGYKLHYDHGLQTQNGSNLNFYGSVQGRRTISKPIVKIGGEIQKADTIFNSRLRWNSDENDLTFYEKITYTQPKWSVGFVNANNVFTKEWKYSAAQLSWRLEDPNTQYYLRVQAGNKFEKVNPWNFLSGISFDVVHSLNPNTKLAAQVYGDLKPLKLINATVAWDYQCADRANTGIKVKADLRRDVNFSIKNSLGSYGSYIFGVGIREFGGANQFSYGIQVDLSL